ncbi:phospholipase [Lottiidibacillus patelloidae]|uniref:Phospholipase n=1 Tax=Lottiidibacillus patelloidae TaxID=2670334 RepID=A0A263BRB7_9BACI|nr:alpha/beta hydrolase [Lottiidibacillus patelloidae]OZM56122.1 phospholipase [Lottiidibacillus patelloidae]
MWHWEANNAKGTIVLVHGAAEYHGRYGWLIEMFRAEGFHVLMDDLPGQGITTRKRGHIQSFDQYIDKVEEWVNEALQYQLPIFLLGHSMGGLIIIRTLMEKTIPVKAVILSSPCLGIKHHPPIFMNVLSCVLNKCVPSMAFHSHLDPRMATRNERRIEFDFNDSLLVEKVSVRWYRELVHAMKLAHKRPEKFKDVPLLVLQGGSDMIVEKFDVYRWFNAITNKEKTYKEFPRLFHDIFHEPEREEVFTTATTFIKSHL